MKIIENFFKTLPILKQKMNLKHSGKMKWIFIIFIVVAIVSGCTPRTKYERILKKELASGIQQDSLFLDIRFGMTQIDFYTHCWQLNKKGLIKQGDGNNSVEYKMENQLKHPATMNFYPSFYQRKIYEMPVQFSYNGWSPWNEELGADQLQEDVLNWYKAIYGNNFIEVEHPERGKAFVNINGNRRITIFKEDDMNVWAVFTDMTVEPEVANLPDRVFQQELPTNDLKEDTNDAE